VLFPENLTAWHITFGTYGARLHGDSRPTVTRTNNQRGQPFHAPDGRRLDMARTLMRYSPVFLSPPQCSHIERVLPDLCLRGGWKLLTCAAAGNHVHVLCAAPSAVHGRTIRALLKRWLTQSLDEAWPRSDGRPWWAEGGSNKPIKDGAYLSNAYVYILRQRTTR
jgi:REP element-mobilizing transposase RayT